MDVFGQFLDERADPRSRAANALDAKKGAELWETMGQTPEKRLLAFDAWVRRELATRIDWTWAGAQKERRIEQCRVQLEQLVLELWRRGWMLDGRRLAGHLQAVMDAVGKYQREGKVLDFWAYFRAAVSRYVGANAEELKQEAIRAGVHANQVLAALGVKRPAAGPSLPELVASRADEITKAKAATLREKLARERAQQAACKDAAPQLPMF